MNPEALRRNLAFVAAALKGKDAEPGPDLARFARDENSREILGWLLEDSPLRARVPADALDAFREARAAQAERSARLLATLGRVSAALRSEGVPWVLLKGLGLGERYYGGLDRRGTRDLDLLVEEPDLAAAERALKGIGYRRASIVPVRALALRTVHAFDFIGGDTTIDLHWAIARHPSFRFDPGGVRGRREPLKLGELEVDVPCHEDALAFAALAIFRDFQRGALRVRALVDLYRIARACPALDVPGFLARRRAEGTHRITANVLALVLEALDARDDLPAIAAAVDSARDDVCVDASTHLRLLAATRLALSNRLFAIRLYEGSHLRWIFWWLLSMPVRVLAHRSWRLPRRRRRRR